MLHGTNGIITAESSAKLKMNLQNNNWKVLKNKYDTNFNWEKATKADHYLFKRRVAQILKWSIHAQEGEWLRQVYIARDNQDTTVFKLNI